MIKPSYNGGMASIVDYVTYKVLISDTTSRSFTPPPIWNMTHKLRQIYRCEIFIISKDMQIDLIILRKRILIYSQ